MDDSPGAVRDDSLGNTVTEQVKAQTQQAVQQTQDTAGQVASQVQNRAQSMLESRKQQGADSMTSLAQALRQSGQTLRDQDQGAVAQVADRAAEQIERFSGYLRQRNVNQIVGEVEDVARRNPPLFLGGAFALGVIAARFLKSSSSGATDTSDFVTGTSGYTPPVSAAGTFDEDVDVTRSGLGATGNAYRSSDAELRTGDGA